MLFMLKRLLSLALLNKIIIMKILSHKMFEFYTTYKIQYKNNVYTCNFNGGLPKLEGINLTESLRIELNDIIEDYFLNKIM